MYKVKYNPTKDHTVHTYLRIISGDLFGLCLEVALPNFWCSGGEHGNLKKKSEVSVVANSGD